MLPAFLLDSLAAVAVFAVAYGLIRVGLLQYAVLAPSDADAVPLLHVLAILAGLLFGLLLLGSVPYADDFRPSRIYAADSPWKIDVWAFLGRHALPDGATVRAAAARLGRGETGWPALAGMAGLGLATVGAIQAALLWRGWARLRAGLAVLQLTLWAALVLHYGLHLLAWGATQLNFWLFAVLLVLWQRWRYGAERMAH